MPSPPKDRPSGRLGRLLAALRPSRAGPLPVQTGFPTSLADLVVKNHGRLKKQPSPCSKRGKRGAAASTSPSLSTPTSPTPSPPPASPPPPPPAAAVAVSPSDQPRPDLPPVPQPARRGKGGGFGLGLGFLAVSGVVSLALLVIWSKKVVAAVTVAAFSLYLLESVRSSSSLSLPPRRRPRPAVAERRLCLDGRGRVSPIREVDADTEPSRPSCSDSDRASDACILAAVEVDERSISGFVDESSNPKAKARKKSWKKLLAASAKKLHRGGRRSKEAGLSGSSSFRSEGDRADDATALGAGGGNAKAADSSGSRRGSAGQTGAAADAAAAAIEADSSRGSRRSQGVEVDADAAGVEIEASVDDLIEEAEEEEEEEQAGTRFPALVLVAIVLVGLVSGKLLALALTVLCAAFLSSVQRSPCVGGGGGCSQGRRLEPSVS